MCMKSMLEPATSICWLGMDTMAEVICNVQGVLAMPLVIYLRLAVGMTSKKPWRRCLGK